MKKERTEEVVAMADESIRIYSEHLEFLRHIIGLSTEAKKAFADFNPLLDSADFDEMITMHSFNSLLTVSLLDLFVICKYLVAAENDWEKVFFLKQGYLTIYETIDTYNSYNLNISKIIDIKYSSLKNKYLSASSNLKQFKKEYSYQDHIKNVRHLIAGHIDKNFINYYDTLLKIKGGDESGAILAFIEILREIQDISYEMEQLSKLHAAAELEKDGMGTTLNEISLNFDKKIQSFKLRVEQKRLELKEQITISNISIDASREGC